MDRRFKMSDNVNKINAEELEGVVGGVKRYVQNDSVGYANVRSKPGLDSKVLYKFPNGHDVYTTGKKVTKDGYTWYQIFCDEAPDGFGWISGSLIGY